MKHAAVVIGLVAAQWMVGGPSPGLIREIDLNQITPGVADSPRVPAISFSPDEMWIAVSAGPRLELLSREGDRRIEIDAGLEIEGTPAWSPTSDSVLVQGRAPGPNPPVGIAKLYNVRGEELWKRNGPGLRPGVPAGGIFGFLDAGHLLAAGMLTKGKPTSIDRLDLQGHLVNSWTLPKGWTVAAVNPDRGLLAMFSDPEDSKTLIVDYSTKNVIQTFDNHTWLEPDGFLGGIPWEYFADGGRAFCSVTSVEKYNSKAECRDVDSGLKINEFRRFQGGTSAREFQSFYEGAPPEATTQGSRLVLTHVTSFASKKASRGKPVVYGERVVWDFRSGAEVATLGMPQQVWRNVTRSFTQPVPPPIVISATGRYVAEVANGVLRIYDLP